MKKKMLALISACLCMAMVLTGCNLDFTTKLQRANIYQSGSGDRISIRADMKAGYDISAAIPFEVTKKRSDETILVGQFAEDLAFYQVEELIDDGKAEELGTGKKDGNKYIFYTTGEEYDYIVKLTGGNTCILFGGFDEEEAQEAFDALSIELVNEDGAKPEKEEQEEGRLPSFGLGEEQGSAAEPEEPETGSDSTSEPEEQKPVAPEVPEKEEDKPQQRPMEPAEPEAPEVQTQSSDFSWDNMVITIDGTTYKLGDPYSKLPQAGWDFNVRDYHDTDTYMLNKGDKTIGGIKLTNPKYCNADNKYWAPSISIGVVNLNTEIKDVKDCVLWNIEYEVSDTHMDELQPKVEFAGLPIGATRDQVEAVLGKPVSEYRSDDLGYYSLDFEDPKEFGRQVRTVIYDSVGLVEITLYDYTMG